MVVVSRLPSRPARFGASFGDLLDAVAVQAEHGADLGVAVPLGAQFEDRGVADGLEAFPPSGDLAVPVAGVACTVGGVGDLLNLVDDGQLVLHVVIVVGIWSNLAVVGTRATRNREGEPDGHDDHQRDRQGHLRRNLGT